MSDTAGPRVIYVTCYGAITRLVTEIEAERVEQLLRLLMAKGVEGFLTEFRDDIAQLTTKEKAGLLRHCRALLRTRLEGLNDENAPFAQSRVLFIGWNGKPQ